MITGAKGLNLHKTALKQENGLEPFTILTAAFNLSFLIHLKTFPL